MAKGMENQEVRPANNNLQNGVGGIGEGNKSAEESEAIYTDPDWGRACFSEKEGFSKLPYRELQFPAHVSQGNC